MGINGTAFAVWRAAGGGGADVLAARLKGTTWSLVSAPLDIAASNAAGADTGRPRVAVDAAGTPLVAWGENGGVFARRVIGLAPSQYPAAVSLPELGTADLPEVDVEEDGSFGWVAFRQRDADGPRALARRIRGLQFDPPSVLDTGAGAGPPMVSINGRGAGAAVVPAGRRRRAVRRHRGRQRVRSAPGRVDTQGGDGLADVGLAFSDSRDLAIAWRRAEGETGGAVLARYRPAGKPWEDETLLSPPDFGPVVAGSLHVGANRNGDIAVAMLQGGPADRRVVVASYDLPPGRAFPSAAGGWVHESQPVAAVGGRQRPVGPRRLPGADRRRRRRRHARRDEGDAGARAAGRRHAHDPGRHRRSARPVGALRRAQVQRRHLGADRRAQRQRRRRARGGPSRSTSRRPTRGRASRRSPSTTATGRLGAAGADTVHRWARPGRYTITASVADKAGNAATATATVRIRK